MKNKKKRKKKSILFLYSLLLFFSLFPFLRSPPLPNHRRKIRSSTQAPLYPRSPRGALNEVSCRKSLGAPVRRLLGRRLCPRSSSPPFCATTRRASFLDFRVKTNRVATIAASSLHYNRRAGNVCPGTLLALSWPLNPSFPPPTSRKAQTVASRWFLVLVHRHLQGILRPKSSLKRLSTVELPLEHNTISLCRGAPLRKHTARQPAWFLIFVFAQVQFDPLQS